MTSARTTFAVLPQRRNAGWQNCPPHAAQRWAVCKITAKGKLRVEKVLNAFQTKAEAEALCARYHSLQQKDAAKRAAQQAGVPRRGKGVIARSLTQEEYPALCSNRERSER